MSISFNQLNGTSVSDASGNTTLGTFSLQGAEFQRGLNNTAIGYGALRANDESAQHNTAVGLNALSNNAGSNNLAIGENALYNFLTPTAEQMGDYNVAIGTNAMQWNTSGYDNVALGNQALYNNTTGYLNVAIGNNALQGTGTGTGNGTASDSESPACTPEERRWHGHTVAATRRQWPALASVREMAPNLESCAWSNLKATRREPGPSSRNNIFKLQ